MSGTIVYIIHNLTTSTRIYGSIVLPPNSRQSVVTLTDGMISDRVAGFISITPDPVGDLLPEPPDSSGGTVPSGQAPSSSITAVSPPPQYLGGIPPGGIVQPAKTVSHIAGGNTGGGCVAGAPRDANGRFV